MPKLIRKIGDTIQVYPLITEVNLPRRVVHGTVIPALKAKITYEARSWAFDPKLGGESNGAESKLCGPGVAQITA